MSRLPKLSILDTLTLDILKASFQNVTYPFLEEMIFLFV